MELLWLDLETRSQVDLLEQGLARYAEDESTEVICMYYAFGDGEIRGWFAEDGEPFPVEVLDHIDQGGILYAQNAAFERIIFDYVLANDYNFTPPKLEQWRCSSARAMAHGLPGSLGDICRALNLPLQKQTEGTRLISWYSKPNFFTEWRGNDKELMGDYCEMDVATMRQFCSVLRELSDDEWAQYHVTERMNDRGVPLDIPFATAALDYADEVKADVDGRILSHTHGAVPNSRARKKRDNWIMPLLTDDQKKLLEVKKKGVTKHSFDQEHRANLALAADLKPEVVTFLNLLEEAGGSAVSKYKYMVNTHVAGRAHGAMIWNGAGQTGRYSSRGLQLQNFKRDVFKDPEPIITDILDGYEVENPSNALGRLVRSAITHESCVTYSDYAQIEARVLPWLADTESAEKTLDVFREDRDIYSENAVGMFRVKSIEDVDADMRQSAKQGVLACLHPDTLVVTWRGPVPLIEVKEDDLLWDGAQWVRHEGVICKGKRETVEVDGVWVTPDHLIKTGQTWSQAQELVSNESTLQSAKETGSESLKLLASTGEAMSRGTSRSLLVRTTVITAEQLMSCKAESTNLSNVYDIVNAGPHNRFTALSKSGALVVHNCGFGGGANAVIAMAKGYGMVMSVDEGNNIKERWRAANPWAEPLWYGIKDAAQRAVRKPGSVESHKRISFMFDGFWLWMRLPSGRCIAYADAKFEWVEYPWGGEGTELTCLWGGGKPKVGEKWPRRTLNHLILTENATQGVAADLMREAIVRAEDAGLPTLFSVHDELVCEGECYDALHEVMETPPTWAEGLPIAADTQVAKRYGK